MTFVCQFGRYIHVELLFRTVSAGDKLQRKRDQIFQEFTKGIDIADDI